MTFIVQPKTEGETKECPSCKEKIVARLKEYKDYPNKIQWQNEKETKAHYDKDGNCKEGTDDESTQQTTTSDNIPDANIEPEKNHPDFLENSKKGPIKTKALLLWHIRCYVELTIKELEVNPNGGMIWEMTKIIYSELYGDKQN